MKHSSRGASLEHDRGRNGASSGGAPGKASQLQLGAGCGRRAGRRRPARSLTVIQSAAYLPGQPRPLSELLSAPQPPRPAAAPPTPPAAPAAPAPAPASSNPSQHPAAAAAAAAAGAANRYSNGSSNGSSGGGSGGLRPPPPPAAAALRNARGGGSGSLPPPHQGLGGSAVHPSSPAVSPRPPPGGGYYQIATGPGGAPLPLSQGFGLPTPDGWSPPSAQAPAAAPYKTVAEPFEAFEPGDTGFSAPTTTEVVTSSSGSVMVKFTAHFSGALGDKVLACGGCRALGNWEPDAAPSLAWGEGDVWTATLELPPGTHEFKCVAIKADPKALPVWEPGNNRRAVVARPTAAGGALPSSSGDEIDLVLGLLSDDEEDHPEAQLVETAGGTTMVKLTTTYTAAFGEYLKVVGGPPELGAWDAGAAPALTWGDGDVWTATLELPAGEHEFKYVVVRQDGRLEWEPGENRRIHVPPPGLAAALEAAKKAVAAEEAAGGNGARPLSLPGRRLSPAEIYELQEATEQLEPWQHVEREQAQKELADRAQQQQVAHAAQQHRDDLQQQRMAAMAGSSSNGNGNGSSSNGNGTAALAPKASPPPPPAVPAKPAAPAGWREVKFSTYFKAEFGTFLKVVGGPEQLGAWEVEAAPPLQWSEGDVWSNTLLLPPGTHEFKLVVVNPNNTTAWETGENRIVDVTAAANRDSEAAGVLLAECTFGKTDATQSVWATVDDISPAETPQLLEAPGALSQQQQQAVPESWYSEKQPSDAAAAAAAAQAQRQAQEQHRQEAAAAAPPSQPLQPLDAVVKVFKDRFTPWSSPKASPVSSTDEEAAAEPAAAAAAADAEQQEQQQQQEQQPSAEVGDRWASIIAARKQQPGGDKSAVLFVDNQQQQQGRGGGDDEQQQQGRQQQSWVRDNQPSGSPDSGSSSSSRWDSVIANRQQQQPSEGGSSSRGRSTLHLPEAKAWRPQQQQDGDSDVPERFASQISRIRSRSPSPEPRRDEQQQQEQQHWDRQEQQQQQQQQQQQTGAPERFSSQIQDIRSRSPEPPREQQQQQQQQREWRREQQPDERQQQQRREQDSSSGSERFASQIQQIRSRSPEPPRQQWEQQQQEDREPEQQQPQWWQQVKEQQQQPPAARQQQQEQPQAAHDQQQPNQQQQQPQRRSGSWRTNWRTASPSPADAGAGDAAAPSSSSSSDGRFANYTPRQQQQQESTTSRGSWRSSPSPSSSGSEYSSASSSWDSSDDAPGRTAARGDAAAATAAEQQSWRSRWRSPSPQAAGDASGDDDTAAAGSSSNSNVRRSGRFSKFTSGSSWRSSSPTQEQQTSPPPQLQQQPSAGDSTSAQQQQQQQKQQRRFQSSWDAVEAGGGRGKGADYLFELGQSDYNTNVDAGQNSSMIDSLFSGNVLGHKSDIADGSLRGWGTRTYANLVGDYYIAPTFMDKVTMHITKNYLADQAAISKNVKVPLVLGIWGPKGCGKTFQTELAFKKLGVEAVVMSAGELESEVAGQPGRLIRERYRKAAELSKVRGKLSCLVINDLDAGIGRFGNTQVTVNNQIVIGTLMNICDDPNRVSVGAGWRENDTIRRVPIIVTGNDFSTLYAPLIRDGRMEKFYWEPNREEVVNIVHQMYKDDGLSRQDIETLVATFGNQALDFFGALRASTYDAQIRDWMQEVAGATLDVAEESRVKEMNRRLLTQKDLPEFEPVPLTLAMLVAEGLRLVQEQDLVNSTKLGEEYMKGVAWGDVDTGGAWSSSEESGGGGISLLG